MCIQLPDCHTTTQPVRLPACLSICPSVCLSVRVLLDFHIRNFEEIIFNNCNNNNSKKKKKNNNKKKGSSNIYKSISCSI